MPASNSPAQICKNLREGNYGFKWTRFGKIHPSKDKAPVALQNTRSTRTLAADLFNHPQTPTEFSIHGWDAPARGAAQQRFHREAPRHGPAPRQQRLCISQSLPQSLSKREGLRNSPSFPRRKERPRPDVPLSLSLSLSLSLWKRRTRTTKNWLSGALFRFSQEDRFDDERVLCQPLFFRETRSAFSGIFWETFAFQFKDTRLVPVKFTKGHLRRCLGLPKHRSQNSTEFHNTAQRCEQSARQRFVARARRGLRDDPFPFRPTRKREGDASLFTEEAPNEKNPPRRGQSQEFRRRVSITAQAAKAKTRPSAQALTSGAHRCSSRAQASTHSSSGAGGRDSSAACLRRHTVSISAAQSSNRNYGTFPVSRDLGTIDVFQRILVDRST